MARPRLLSGFLNKVLSKYELYEHAFYRRLMILFYYNKRFFSIGQGFDFNCKSWIHGQGTISAGKGLVLWGKSEIWAGNNATILIGDHVYKSGGAIISSKVKIEIGDSTIIGHQVLMFDTDFHGIDGHETKQAPIIIGKHV